jgi:hypothetical protein
MGEALIRPQMLSWAVHRAQASVETIAKRIGTTQEIVTDRTL